MPFGLTIGTERANALQQSIQDELTKRGYSPDADPVMAEYITIMVINNKTPAQITTELEDLIGSDYDPSFTDWLFAEAAKGTPESDAMPQAGPSTTERTVEAPTTKDASPQHPNDPPRKALPRNGVYQQAISQVLPSAPTSGQKRPSSVRSPSPTHPNKSRRTDVPTGPRAMQKEVGGQPSRSLLDRVGGHARNPTHDDIQSRIDNIVNNSADQNVMLPGGFPVVGANGMDMNAMAAAGLANPLMLQEMMMNQMALMAQMASSMGMMGTPSGQFVGPGFPMQGVMPGDMSMFPNAGMGGPFPGPSGMNTPGRGRGIGRGRGGRASGRGGSHVTPATSRTPDISAQETVPQPPAAPVVAPTPVAANGANAPVSISAIPQPRPGFTPPERPQSPTLCKFGLKCTNAYCRYAHPSPVATIESGVVLSNEACEKGRDCKDKDCIKAHVSPAVLNPQAVEHPSPSSTTSSHPSPIPCRFGVSCTRPGCTYAHPLRSNHFTQQCRFGASCTRATCPFQHPEGRVLPNSFHRGLSKNAPLINVQAPEAGSMGAASPHKSMKFNTPRSTPSVKEKLEKQVKELEEKKNEAEKAVREAEAAASKKDESKPVAIAA